jgi:hypothetical protein
VDPRGGLDDVEKRKFLILQGLKLRPLGRPARSQSLYRLSYSGSQKKNRVLRRMFGIKVEEVAGEWRKLHNEELHNSYS